MINLYEEYASEQDRKDAVYLESCEIELERAMLAVETCEKMEELNLRDAELKCVLEEASGADISHYYAEAAEKTDEKKKGLIRTAWEKIVKLFKSIGEKLFGKATEIDDNAEYSVNEDDINDANAIQKAWAKMKGFVKHPVGGAIGILAATAAIVGTIVVLRKKKGEKTDSNSKERKIKGIDFKKFFSNLKKTEKEMEGSAEENAKNPDNAGDGEAETKSRNLFSQIGSAIRGVVSNLLAAIKNSKVAVSMDNKKRAKEADKKAEASISKAKNLFGMGDATEESGNDDVDLFDSVNFTESFDDLLNADEYQESAGDGEINDILSDII